MPIYIYRSGGSGGGPRNPLVNLLVSAAILAGIIGLGIVLLPVFGIVILIILGLVAFLLVGAMIYRWIYGDPFAEAMKRAQSAQVNPGFRQAERPDTTARPANSKLWGKSQRGDVEDAVVVEEKPRRD